MSTPHAGEELARLAEERARLQQQKRWLKQLNRDTETARNRSEELRKQLRKEVRDVERLEYSALTRFLLTLFDDQKLDREKREAAEAEIRSEQADAELRSLEAALAATAAEVKRLPGVESEYKHLLDAETSNLIHGPAELAEPLREKLQLQEPLRKKAALLRRASSSAATTASKLQEAASQIGSARSWGAFDMFGGGLIASMVKRSKVDHTAAAVTEAQVHLNSLQFELKELGETAHLPSVTVDVGHRLMDVFLDNIFTDVAVQGRIGEAQKSIDRQIDAVERVSRRLSEIASETERQLAQVSTEVEQYVRDARR